METVLIECKVVQSLMVAMETLLVAMVTMAAMQIVYKLFVQSDAHIHHHCQETYRCLLIVVAMATILVDYT